MLGNCAMRSGSWQAVQVSEQNERSLGRTAAKPFVAGQQARLAQTFAPTQAEMGIHDANEAKRRLRIHGNRPAFLPTPGWRHRWQFACSSEGQRVTADDGIPVVFVAGAH